MPNKRLFRSLRIGDEIVARDKGETLHFYRGDTEIYEFYLGELDRTGAVDNVDMIVRMTNDALACSGHKLVLVGVKGLDGRTMGPSPVSFRRIRSWIERNADKHGDQPNISSYIFRLEKA